jgi:hypothetical protein
MDISSIGGGSAASSPASTGQAKSSADSQAGSTFAALMNGDTPYDEVKVDLPNGMSIGVVHFGGGGLDSNALKSIEDFVQRMASQDTSGNRVSGADRAGNDDTPDVAGLDKIHVDLPNGISFEVLHSSGGQPTDSDAALESLTDIAEELADAFAGYAPASSAAATYAARQATSSGSGNQVGTPA